ncbi:MAG: radical SAM protein [Planctomycetales bacterium]|nr:radical SAM protein [Planctomycetales bacterium]
MRRVKNLELHVVHGCNLACESCSHYSNQGHKGMVALEEADRWMRLWNGRLAPERFSLLGGEPTLHPELPAFVSLARRRWPNSALRLVTNGFFLHRHPELPQVLRDDPNACLYVSIHHDAPQYQERLEPILALVEDWKSRHGVRVELYPSHRNWTRRYHGFGSAMQPFTDGDPRRSWENCPAKTCPQLLEGCIWKCGPLAYLPMQAAKYDLSGAWRPYLGYQPLAPDCTDEALHAFFDREEESHCGICAAEPQRFELPVPLALDAARRAAGS